jgi:hypothetical protein
MWSALSGSRFSVRPWSECPNEELEMSHSLIGADCCTCCKIVAVALAGSIGMLMLSMSLVISIAAWRAEAEAPTSLTLANEPGFEAGKATISATLGAPVIR